MRCFIFFIIFCFFLCGCSTFQTSNKEKNILGNKVESKVEASPKQQVPFMPNMDIVNSKSGDAYAIYSSSQTPSESGVYEYGNYIFVIVVIDYNKEKLASPEASAMLRTAAMLRKKYNLPEIYDLPCSVLENEDDEEHFIYRRVSVFDLNKVKQMGALTISLPACPEKVKNINKKIHNQNKGIPSKRASKQKAIPHSNSSAQIGTFCGDKNVEDDF